MQPQPFALMPESLAAAARERKTRGFTHLFLGSPMAFSLDKTAVEPGGAFSPGICTCGIRTWLTDGGDWRSADDLPEERVAFTLIESPGAAPLAVSRWRCGDASVAQRHGQLGAEGAEGLDVVEISVDRKTDVGITVTDRGPAGAKLGELHWDAATGTLRIAGAGRLVVECETVEAAILPVDSAHDSPVAALVLRGVDRVLLRFHHDRGEDSLLPRRGLHDGLDAAQALRTLTDGWRQELPARIFAPDARVALAWERNAYHLMAAAEHGCARIGVLTYPQLWLRDGVIVARAFDLIGRFDLARLACEEILPGLFAGGSGAEADAPGEGIWLLVQHALFNHDRAFLARAWPFIVERLRWLEAMIDAERPLLVPGFNRSVGTLSRADGLLLCDRARDGTVHGRMDGHFPDFYNNCWCVAGLEQAALAAETLGLSAEAVRLRTRGAALLSAVERVLLPLYGNERDPAVAPWPSGTLPGGREKLAESFIAWYRRERLSSEGGRRPELLWTYFEAAQAHNAVLLGFRREAWICLDGMLAANGNCDAQIHHEGGAGGGEALPFANGAGLRGWLAPERKVGNNMPHNWTTAEMVAALRDVFVIDESDHLRLGAGVPETWMKPGGRFGVENLPTRHGPISYTVTIGRDGTPHLDCKAGVRCVLNLPC